uniref:serine/threonine-protein kinase n=1 Tax=Streptomyces sp. YIM 98790 TaxID=2689077 RepID=UPI001407671D
MVESLHAEDPQAIGGYVLLGRLGAGGMGRVYLARTPGGRALALKTILAERTGDPGFRLRFAREIRNADRVRSPWTVPVVDWSRGDGPQWLATEYVPAPSLEDWVLRAGPLAPEAVRELAAELTAALAAVHAEGLVHRDLKPSNVLLAPQRPQLIDFGIARALDDSPVTHTGGVVGSPGYLAPEQVGGARELSPAADVFALGALLVFAATGHGPFQHTGESPATATLLYRVMHEPPVLDDLPGGLRPVVEPLLAKEPGARPAAAALTAERGAGGGRWARALPD